jgi:hypothetical protein
LLNEMADEAAAAIEEAAGEAAKAAALAAVREQAANIAASNLALVKLKNEYALSKKETMKNMIIAVTLGFLGGSVAGGATIFLLGAGDDERQNQGEGFGDGASAGRGGEGEAAEAGICAAGVTDSGAAYGIPASQYCDEGGGRADRRRASTRAGENEGGCRGLYTGWDGVDG